jgi:tetratricopeptide (TPR) repeat protein
MNVKFVKIKSNFKKFSLNLIPVFISGLVFSSVTLGGWLDWDDPIYVLNNPLIENLSIESVVNIFKTWNYEGNYQPFTFLVLAFEKQLFNSSPFGYHAINLVIHLFNVFLVSKLISHLSNNLWVAAFVAIMFGIHPAHVESVAWVTGIKDLLYTQFFLLGLIVYEISKRDTNSRWMVLFYMAFILSLLSKAQAVVFPIILILMDFHQGRSLTINNQKDKVVPFLLSFVFGILAVFAQKEAGSTLTQTDYPFFEQVSYAGLAFLKYLVLAVAPIQLTPFHSYPVQFGETIPLYVYGSLILSIIVSVGMVRLLKARKKMLFGFLFFVVSIFPVLQVFAVGGAIIAERYTYLSFLGLFYLFGLIIFEIYTKRKTNLDRRVLASVVILFLGLISFQSYTYIPSWSSTESLWNKAIEYNPADFHSSFRRGVNRSRLENLEGAIQDFDRCILIYDKSSKVYFQKGIVQLKQEKWRLAIQDFRMVINLDSTNYAAYTNLGICYLNLAEFEKALGFFKTSVELNADFYGAYLNIGILHNELRNYSEAIRTFNSLINKQKLMEQSMFNRAKAFYFQGNKQMAIADLEMLIKYYPEYEEYQYWLQKARILNPNNIME